MTTIAQFVGRKDRTKFIAPNVELPLPHNLIGVEVEVDSDTSFTPVFPIDYQPEWTRKSDGSLRDGWEYVLSTPLKGEDLANAVYKLYSGNTKIGRTFTGSTHIHVDMMDGTQLEHVRTLVFLTYVFEVMLYAAGDITRQWCGYANRLTSAPAEAIEHILKLENQGDFRVYMDEVGRYYGLNLAALSKYGSVEFRYFPTAESAEELMRWIILVQKFKKAAIEVGTTEELIKILSTEEGYNEFLNKYFDGYEKEASAVGDYSKIKSLMYKALIICRAKPSHYPVYSREIILNKYKSVLVTKGNTPASDNIAFEYTARSQRAPSAETIYNNYVAATGKEPVIVALYHNSNVCYIGCKFPYGWDWIDVSNSYPHDINLAQTILNYRDILLQLALGAQNPEAMVSTLTAQLDSLATNYQLYIAPDNCPTPPLVDDEDETPDYYEEDDA